MNRYLHTFLTIFLVLIFFSSDVFARRESLLRLRDTPNSYSGEAGKTIVVNSAETGTEFISASGTGDMTKAVYDTNEDNLIDANRIASLSSIYLTLSQIGIAYDTEAELDSLFGAKLTTSVLGAAYDTEAELAALFDARCLESVFGTALSTGMLLDGTDSKVSAILQEYHAVNPTAAGLALLDDADNVAQLVTLGINATASEINTPLDGASVTLTEFQELETIDTTTISADQWAELGGTSTADITTAFAGYKRTISSTLNTAGSVFSLTNTTADLTADVSFFDFKFTDDGDANGFFLRGYDNSGNDLKWYIGADGDADFGALTCTSVTTDSTASPAWILYDPDGEGADLADKESVKGYGQLTTTTEDGEISDLRYASFGAGTAGTEYTNYWWDSSAKILRLGVMTNADAPVGVASTGLYSFNFATGETDDGAHVSAIIHKTWAFDPDAICDGDIDRLFLLTVGDEAPNGIIIDEWKVSYEADPTTEADLDLKYADAFIGVANAAVIDILDTTTGTSSEDTDASINTDGSAIANGKVMYLEFGTAYTETGHQVIFEIWYHSVED